MRRYGGGEVDRVAVGYVRSVLTAPDVLVWIEPGEALRRAGELAQTCDDVDADGTRKQLVQREIERLTDAVAEMGLSTALAVRLREAEAERDALKRVRTRGSVAPLRRPSGPKCTRW